MPGAADFIQKAVHALEAGEWAPWIRRGLAIVAIVGLALFYLLHEFRGLATSQGMDQAQIGRELLRGNGFATKLIRPRAVGQFREHGRDVIRGLTSDTYNAPLPCLVNAIALLPVRAKLQMGGSDPVYVGDKMIAAMSIALFIASVVVLFFSARRLFDDRIALLGCALVLLGDMMWQYALSGLPQMLMLLLFNVTVYLLARACEAQVNGATLWSWSAAAGVGFGLLALSHALTLWLFFPAAVFCAIRLNWRAAAVMFTGFAVVYAPWLIRTAAVSGNVGGVAIYSLFDGMNHTEAGHLRRVALDLSGVGIGFFRAKFSGNLVTQFGSLVRYFGWSIVALMFFPALLHRFRRDETSVTRWLLLAMWAGAVFGMSLYGINEEQDAAANQLHLLFVPLMTCFGLAYLLVLWNRRELIFPLARQAFLAALFLLSAAPMIYSLILSPHKPLVRWPPYVPPYIAVLNDWMLPNEIIASDMPWAVAWYADRRALWLPESPAAMTEFSDYRVAGAPVNGLYLTPVSGSQNKLSDIVRGEYKEWSDVILRRIDSQKFPLKWATFLGLENDCIFFSDHDRTKTPRK